MALFLRAFSSGADLSADECECLAPPEAGLKQRHLLHALSARPHHDNLSHFLFGCAAAVPHLSVVCQRGGERERKGGRGGTRGWRGGPPACCSCSGDVLWLINMIVPWLPLFPQQCFAVRSRQQLPSPYLLLLLLLLLRSNASHMASQRRTTLCLTFTDNRMLFE